MFLVRVGTGPPLEVHGLPMFLIRVGTGHLQPVVGKNGEQKFELDPLFTVFPSRGVPAVCSLCTRLFKDGVILRF